MPDVTPSEVSAYARHSRISDPGELAPFLETFPSQPSALGAAIRNLTAHHRATPGIPESRMGEPDTRWVRDILRLIRNRSDAPLSEPRPLEARFVGCCRDDALLFVAALRQHGVPARSRVGFAPYFSPNFFHDHVIAEYWNAKRWVRIDPELDPASFPFDTENMPPEAFLSAARVWQAYRAGQLDPQAYGVFPEAPDFLRGPGFIRDYVLRELAALSGWELLLWDDWGLIGRPLAELGEDDLALLDELAAALVADDAEVIARLAAHPRLLVPDTITTWVRREQRAEVRLS